MSIKESDGWALFGVGVVVGILSLTALDKIFTGVASQYHDAINKCQEDLPRNRRCVITAIPDLSPVFPILEESE